LGEWSDLSTNNYSIHSVLQALALVDIVALLNWTYVSTIGKSFRGYTVLEGLTEEESIPGIQNEPCLESGTNIYRRPNCKVSNALEELGYKRQQEETAGLLLAP
jgi:hypothetical protein